MQRPGRVTVVDKRRLRTHPLLPVPTATDRSETYCTAQSQIHTIRILFEKKRKKKRKSQRVMFH